MSALSTALFLTHPEVDPIFQKMSMDKSSAPNSTATSRKTSLDSQHSATPSSTSSSGGAFHKLGKKIVKAAKDHHKSVNSAFTAYYGLPIQGGKKN
ncbi:hypothetical protein ONS96_002463 [Cadophora gregata f. sp. sojae]|nr:hypothetical protein ONS96_002463 [Cadophora gregata f. sp. sojae]